MQTRMIRYMLGALALVVLLAPTVAFAQETVNGTVTITNDMSDSISLTDSDATISITTPDTPTESDAHSVRYFNSAGTTKKVTLEIDAAEALPSTVTLEAEVRNLASGGGTAASGWVAITESAATLISAIDNGAAYTADVYFRATATGSFDATATALTVVYTLSTE